MRGKGTRPHWSEQDDARLRFMWKQGVSAKEIGVTLGRSPDSVFTRVYRLNLGKRILRESPGVTGPKTKPVSDQWKKRTCLSCHNIFNSWGPGNRICVRCRPAVNDAAGGLAEAGAV